MATRRHRDPANRWRSVRQALRTWAAVSHFAAEALDLLPGGVCPTVGLRSRLYTQEEVVSLDRVSAVRIALLGLARKWYRDPVQLPRLERAQLDLVKAIKTMEVTREVWKAQQPRISDQSEDATPEEYQRRVKQHLRLRRRWDAAQDGVRDAEKAVDVALADAVDMLVDRYRPVARRAARRYRRLEKQQQQP